MKLKFDETKQKLKMYPILVKFDELGGLPNEIHILPKGKWEHPVYGNMEITNEDLEVFMKHFDEGLRKDIPITEGHAVGDEEKPAVGWFKRLIHKENGLWAVVEWTKAGKDLLMQKAYKYFSPEFYRQYEDPESREVFDNVLVGGALTNKPYFKELTPVVLSEYIINKFSEDNMNIKDLLKKKTSEMTPEEKAYMKKMMPDKKMMSELSEEEQKTAKVMFDELSAEEGGEKKEEAGDKSAEEGEKKEEVKEEEKKEEEKKEEVKEEEKVEASEKNTVQISASELKILQEKADQGAEALKKLKMSEINSAVEKMVFSESNKKGKFLPKSKDKVSKFMETLSDKQLAAFKEVIAELPEAKIFSELGSGSGIEAGSAYAEVQGKITELQKTDTKLTFSDALRKVSKENPELMKRYNDEMASK